LDLQQVQADEIKVRTQMGIVWMALAIMVHTRLWLGGVVGSRRDKAMLQQLADQLRNIALCRALLLAVDGWRAYVDVLRKAFRTPLQDGSLGRPRLIAWADVHIVQVVKQRSTGQLTIERRIVQGCAAALSALLSQTQGSGVINTAYIERLNATFRQRMGCLTRHTRHLARQQPTLQAGMYLVGTVYNFCTYHDSLRLKLWLTERIYRWVHRTPIMAVGLSDHRWSVHELMTFKSRPLPMSHQNGAVASLNRHLRRHSHDYAILWCYQELKWELILLKFGQNDTYLHNIPRWITACHCLFYHTTCKVNLSSDQSFIKPFKICRKSSKRIAFR
jgi:hypothetical protein